MTSGIDEVTSVFDSFALVIDSIASVSRAYSRDLGAGNELARSVDIALKEKARREASPFCVSDSLRGSKKILTLYYQNTKFEQKQGQLSWGGVACNSHVMRGHYFGF